MAKSSIIKDIANSAIDISTALKRAKILFASLNNIELLNWVDYEISGYPIDTPLPDYRIECGTVKGSYVRASGTTIVKYNDVSIPLGKMPKEEIDELLKVSLYDGINALKQLVNNSENGQLAKPLPADFYPYICEYNNDPYMSIVTARVVISTHCVTNIFSLLENRLLDALLLLEKEFGLLDDLDIDTSKKTSNELNAIAKQIYISIYNDKSIHIGNDNKIKDSSISNNK